VLSAMLELAALQTANGSKFLPFGPQNGAGRSQEAPLKHPAPPEALPGPGWCAKGNSRSYFFCSSRM